MRRTRSGARLGVLRPEALVDGAVLAVDRHQLGARRRPGPAARPGPPAMSDSLLARARRCPAARVARVTPQPGEADHAVDAHVGLAGEAGQRLGSGHAPRCPGARWPRAVGRAASAMATTLGRTTGGLGGQQRRPTTLAPRATTSKRSGSAPTTSSVWVPIDPVDPARATVVVVTQGSLRPRGPEPVRATMRAMPWCSRPEHTAGSTKSRPSKRSSRPPWPGRIDAHVLHAEVALEQRLAQVAERGGEGDGEADVGPVLQPVDRLRGR